MIATSARLLAAAAVSAVAAAPLAAKPAAVTSAYTKLDLDKCKELESDLAWVRWRCPGHKSVALIVEVSDDRFDLDAGVPDNDELFGASFDSPPDTVEWRLIRGKPFALIYRLTGANPEQPRTSRLLVETIGRAGTPGCRVAEIPGSAPNANQAARDAAATILAGNARCLGPKARR
jgi:hypothetical protein